MCGQDLKMILRREANSLNGIHHEVECEDPLCGSVDERVVDTRNQQWGKTEVNQEPGPRITQSAAWMAATASSHAGGSCGLSRTDRTRPLVVATAAWPRTEVISKG